ncbi:MAG TPA: alanine racemase, partial [Paraburkholderia sp.]|nr:alanine racemase [Paraburkholderia sp.]
MAQTTSQRRQLSPAGSLMPRPISVRIHPEAVRHNLQTAKQSASGARVWAVVKANAYGHGIER